MRAAASEPQRSKHLMNLLGLNLGLQWRRRKTDKRDPCDSPVGTVAKVWAMNANAF